MSTHELTKLKFGICPECGSCSGELPTNCESFADLVCPEKLYETALDPICDLTSVLICSIFLGVLACPYAITRHLCCLGCTKTYGCCKNTLCVKKELITIQPI